MKRLETEAKMKLVAVEAAVTVHGLMTPRPDGWSLMVGRPSAELILALEASLEGSSR